MQLSARKLAAALASRLTAVVPLPVRVFVEETPKPLLLPDEGIDEIIVRVASGSELWGGQVLSDLDLEPDDDSSVPDLAAGWAATVLSGVQDSVSTILREPWPRLHSGGMALPDARADALRVHLWYGASEDRAALSLRPIELSEIVR
ncbi:MAG TPA: hypothetical protein VIP11_03260 [Gemmatimonadaceae bacterium]